MYFLELILNTPELWLPALTAILGGGFEWVRRQLIKLVVTKSIEQEREMQKRTDDAKAKLKTEFQEEIKGLQKHFENTISEIAKDNAQNVKEHKDALTAQQKKHAAELLEKQKAHNELQHEYDKTKAKNEQVENEIIDLSRQIEAMSSSIALFEEKLREVNKLAKAQQEKINVLEQELAVERIARTELEKQWQFSRGEVTGMIELAKAMNVSIHIEPEKNPPKPSTKQSKEPFDEPKPEPKPKH